MAGVADDQGRSIIRTGGPQTMHESDKRFSSIWSDKHIDPSKDFISFLCIILYTELALISVINVSLLFPDCFRRADKFIKFVES